KLMLDLIEKVRDESDSENHVRLVFEPKSNRLNPEHFMNTLMAQTSLEGNVSINLVMMGMDNRPAQKNLKTILQEWIDYRVHTVTRRLQYRLNTVEKRIHILQGRHKVFLQIDEVIRVIRESDDPKTDLIHVFGLTEIQADDILEIRLRQLARLEGFKLENELNELHEEQSSLKHLLSHDDAKKKLIIKEMQQDMKQFGDARRTLVETAERATLTQTTVDEPITLIVSRLGWIRARTGHDVDIQQITFKEGDDLQQVLQTRTIEPVIVLDTLGRSYTINPADVPKGRGDGVPIGSMIELQNGASVLALLTGAADEHYLLANSGGYGFICKLEDLSSRLKAGKAVMTLEQGETALLPVHITKESLTQPENYIIAATQHNRLLAFSVTEMKIMAKGRGLQLINLHDNDALVLTACVDTPDYIVSIVGKRGGKSSEQLHLADIVNKRGRKGKILTISGSLKHISKAE
ncbi:MAG: DNA gyrase subunit A, partial [Kingella sp. (in: b-proteobacteria)]